MIKKYIQLKLALISFDLSKYRNIPVDRYIVHFDGSVTLFKKDYYPKEPYSCFIVYGQRSIIPLNYKQTRFLSFLVKKIPKQILRKGIDY